MKIYKEEEENNSEESSQEFGKNIQRGKREINNRMKMSVSKCPKSYSNIY